MSYNFSCRKLGLAQAIDERLHLLKYHLPHDESDHVLNFADDALCNGTCLDDIELRRNDVVFLDALDADRIPDPTAAGDFCRRFTKDDVETFQDVLDQTRVKVWKQQPPDFFDEAVIDADGTLVATAAGCKQGIDIAYDGTWGYQPLIVSLANTGEVLSIVNRPGNCPSHEGAADQLDLAILVCRQAGFRRIYLRGDTDFTQTKQLDAWDAEGVRFLFGIDARTNLKAIAEDIPASAWVELHRPDCGVRRQAGGIRPQPASASTGPDARPGLLRRDSEVAAAGLLAIRNAGRRRDPERGPWRPADAGQWPRRHRRCRG